MKIVIPSFLLVFLFTACMSQQSGRPGTKINRKEYSMQAPAGWQIDSSKQMGTDLVLFSMLDNANDKFRENITVLVQNIAAMNLDLAKYTALSENQIKTMAIDSKIELSVRERSTAGEYQRIIYTATQRGGKLKFEQYYFVKGGKAYVVTLTTEASTFDVYKSAGEQALNSFALK